MIADGPPDTARFVVEHVEVPHLLVLHSTTHVPVAWRERTGARIDWVWSFVLDPVAGGGSRMLIRTRAATWPWWLTAAYIAALVPADHVMASSMLSGLDERSAQALNSSP